MPKSRVRNRPKLAGPPRNPQLTQIENTLRSIDRYQQVEAHGNLPLVPDAMPMQLKAGKVHSVWKTVDKGSLVASTTITQTATYAFALGDVSDSSNYVNVFDQFRIKQVQISFIPDTIGANTTTVLPLISVIDYNDASPLATLAAVYEYDNVLTTQVGQIHTRTLNPTASTPVYNGSVFTAFAQSDNNQWIDTNSTTAQYYGVKTIWLPSAASAQYSVVARYLLQFRNTR